MGKQIALCLSVEKKVIEMAFECFVLVSIFIYLCICIDAIHAANV